MSRSTGILRQDSRNRRSSPSDKLTSNDPNAESIVRLLRRVGEELQLETATLIEALKQVSQAIVNEDLAKVVNGYFRSRRSRILCYDNFFRALNDFRNKLWSGSSSGMNWRTRIEPDECTMEDYETFDALIDLTGKIAEYDENARLYIADNPDWNHPLHVMVTLVSCAIPTTMKATILRTLAAFAKSSGSATLIWQYIGPVLATLTVIGPKQGLKLEMEDIEVRYREFPVTKAIILLVLRIFESLAFQASTPDLTQAFQDFTGYIYDAVFLKADERSFANPQEHLEVLHSCLCLFDSCLRSLNASGLAFVPVLTSHPGYYLRQRLLSGGALFEKLASWVSVCTEELEKVHSDCVKKKLEEVILIISSIFVTVINRHDEFLALLRQNEKNATALGVESLISGTINPRTARKDLLFVFMRLLKLKSRSLETAKNGMKIVDFAMRRREDHRDWIILLYFDENLYKEVLKYTADCLEVDPKDAQKENDHLEAAESLKLVQLSSKMILGILKNCAYPNMAHVILGFPLRSGGLIGSVLGTEALCSTLSRLLDLIEPGAIIFELLPTLTELALDIIDTLCLREITCQAILSFIRSTWTGNLSVRKLLELLPLVDKDNAGTVQYIRHQKAILHIAAKEIRILFDGCMTQSAMELMSLVGNFQIQPISSQGSVSIDGSLLVKLMTIFDLRLPSVEPIRNLPFEVLEASNVDDALAAATIITDDGQVLHDSSIALMYLHELLHVYEENGMGRNDILQDFNILCDYLEREAVVVGHIRSRRECVEAWASLAGVVAESCPGDAFPFPAAPTFFLNLSKIISEKLLLGLGSDNKDQLFATLISSVSAFLRLTGPPRTSLSILECLSVEGFASECLKMDYKSVFVRTNERDIQNLIRNLVELILKSSNTVFDRQWCYDALLLLLKFGDWAFSQFEDVSFGFSPSIQSSVASIRNLFASTLEMQLGALVEQLLSDKAFINGPDEAIALQLLNRIWRLFNQEERVSSHATNDVVPTVIISLAKDNVMLRECIENQSDSQGILFSFEVKMDILTSWISLPGSLPVDPNSASPTFRACVKTILQFDVLNALPLVRDVRNSPNIVQRTIIAGTNLTIYEYCLRIFRKIVDFLISVLDQVRMRPAHRDVMLRTYKYIQYFGIVISDNLKEPTSPDDPSWEDICRTVQLVSLINHHYFGQELNNPHTLDISPEMLAIELKVGRLFHNLGTLIIRPPKGNYKDYHSDLSKRTRSMQLISDLVTYFRRLTFEEGENKINLAVVQPLFIRSFFDKKELARGTVSTSYGDLMEHIRTFCSALSERMTALEGIRNAMVQASDRISTADIQMILDSEYVPHRREDKENFYKLFLKEQQRDACLDLRKLFYILEVLVSVFVVHLEHVFVKFMTDGVSESSMLPTSMRRALLPALERDDPNSFLDKHHQFKRSVCEFITDDFVNLIHGIHDEIGPEANKFLGIYAHRLTVVVSEARSG